MPTTKKKYNTAEKRWAGVGPYYAMFPTSFADKVIEKYTNPGDVILDPFAGRSTAIYSAAIQNRFGIGIELNPVGWVYGKAKLATAKQAQVKDRLEELVSESSKYWKLARQLPVFFKHCYSHEIRKFLLAARDILQWRRSSTDWTLMALLLIYLHGKRGQSLSNQMRQTKAMSQNYAINWWKRHKLTPPDLDPFRFIDKRINWRFSKGLPRTTWSQVYLGDSNLVSNKIGDFLNQRESKSVRLLFTSPPYCGVTNYHYDQWLRLWLLGYPPTENVKRNYTRGRFIDQQKYYTMLLSVFSKVANYLDKDSVIYIRTDLREFTYQTTLEILKQVFPGRKISKRKRPFEKPTQTHLFGDQSPKVGEIDLILRV